MKVVYEDFIAVFSDVYTEGFCEHLIAEFDRLETYGVASNRIQSENSLKHDKSDNQVYMNMYNSEPQLFRGENTQQVFFAGLQKCFEGYTQEYSPLRQDRLRCDSMKVQKTRSGEGYHIWHKEQGSGGAACNRGLVFALYLNTLLPESCGETEFLYQKRRIQPVENTVLFWPASFTHVHRGNPVYNATKYIVTGWFYYD